MARDSSPEDGSRTVQLGKYDVISHIATGGMGAIYKARDTKKNRIYAIKVLTPEIAARPHMIERFRREAAAAAKLKHRNIVRVFELAKIKSTYFLVMEYVNGKDLQAYVKEKGKLSPREAIYIIYQAARALHQAHKHGLVHRDIKPSNFLLAEEDGKALVKLTDFGLARDVDEDQFRLTRDGNTVGTVDYVSPEQARDSGAADIRSDIYSLGCSLFHLLAGRPPFAEGGLTERLYKHAEERPPDIRDHSPNLPDALERILYRMLEKNPADRFQTPRELMKALADSESSPNLSASVLEGLAEMAQESSESDAALRRSGASSGAIARARARKRRQAEDDAERGASERGELPSWLPYLVILAILVALVLIGVTLMKEGKSDGESDADGLKNGAAAAQLAVVKRETLSSREPFVEHEIVRNA